MPNKGSGCITKNLKASENKIAVNTIFIFTPLKKESTTFLADLAPAYLNAFSAKIILGIIPIKPPINADLAELISHIK
jgi:hypothetical protein